MLTLLKSQKSIIQLNVQRCLSVHNCVSVHAYVCMWVCMWVAITVADHAQMLIKSCLSNVIYEIVFIFKENIVLEVQLVDFCLFTWPLKI